MVCNRQLHLQNLITMVFSSLFFCIFWNTWLFLDLYLKSNDWQWFYCKFMNLIRNAEKWRMPSTPTFPSETGMCHNATGGNNEHFTPFDWPSSTETAQTTEEWLWKGEWLHTAGTLFHGQLKHGKARYVKPVGCTLTSASVDTSLSSSLPRLKDETTNGKSCFITITLGCTL